MTTADHRKHRRKLANLIVQAQQRLERLDEHIHHKIGPVSHDFSEQAVETENDETVLALRTVVANEIVLMEQAIERIDHGVYGSCRLCGQPIEPARHCAIPATSLCAPCSSE